MDTNEKTKILVLGSTGKTGGEVARQLIAKGVKPRLLVRSKTRAKEFEGQAEIIEGDYEHPKDIAAALAGMEKLFLVSGLSLDSPAAEMNIIDAAKAAGVKHIVKLSVITADDPKIVLTRLHATTEEHLKASGLAWTMLRPGNFHSNALTLWASTIRTDGVFYQPAGTGRWASIDPIDIANVAVIALMTPGHESKAYNLTGPVTYNADEYAGQLSKALGKPVKFIDIPLEVARAGMADYGVSEAYADAAMELMEAMKENRWTDVAPDAHNLLGRELVSFEDWALRNRAAFL